MSNLFAFGFLVGVIVAIMGFSIVKTLKSSSSTESESGNSVPRGFRVGDSVEHKLMGWKGTITYSWSDNNFDVNFKIGEKLKDKHVNGSEIT